MKCLTIHQPWASLIACGAKKYETRGWATSYRGPIAIHAGKKPVLPWFRREVEEKTRLAIIGALAPHRLSVLTQLPRGVVIATAELVACHRMLGRFSDGKTCIHISPFEANMQEVVITGDELLFGDWQPGRFAWELANVQMLAEPIPARGQHGLFNWDERGLL